jgi:cell division transport system permease protein
LTAHWSDQVEIVAYLDSPPDSRGLQVLQSKIMALQEVEGVNYVSREEAFSQFRKRLGGDADLLDGVDANILPASFDIILKSSYRTQVGVDTVVERLQREVGLKDLRFGREWLEKFESFVVLLKLGGAVIGGFLLFAALFIVSNTIRLTQYARRDELEIMGLVGATSMFIKTPFLIEGAIQGALGGLLAIVTSFVLFRIFLHDGLASLLLASGSGRILFLPLSFQGLLLGAGVFLGFFGSLMSLRTLVRI